MIQPSKRSRHALAALLGAMAFTLAGCATSYGATDVQRSATRQASTVRTGTVTSVQPVTIRGDNNNIATGTGAVLGGLLGSQVGGRNSTQAIGAVGGAVLGGLAGNAAGRAANQRGGYAYIVRFENGESREIVQGDDLYITPGTPVNIIFRADGAVITPAG